MTSENNNNACSSDSFDFLWDNIIFPTLKKCEEDAKNQKFNVEIKDIDSKKSVLYTLFEETREKFKKEWHISRKDACLSYSKLGACLCYSLVRVKFFSFNLVQEEINSARKNNKQINIDTFLINYKSAFYCGAGLVYLWLLSDYAGDATKTKKIQEKGNLFLLKEFDLKTDSTQDYVIKDLAFNDINKKDIDLIQLSVIYRLYKELTKLKLSL